MCDWHPEKPQTQGEFAPVHKLLHRPPLGSHKKDWGWHGGLEKAPLSGAGLVEGSGCCYRKGRKHYREHCPQRTASPVIPGGTGEKPLCLGEGKRKKPLSLEEWQDYEIYIEG